MQVIEKGKKILILRVPPHAGIDENKKANKKAK